MWRVCGPNFTRLHSSTSSPFNSVAVIGLLLDDVPILEVGQIKPSDSDSDVYYKGTKAAFRDLTSASH